MRLTKLEGALITVIVGVLATVVAVLWRPTSPAGKSGAYAPRAPARGGATAAKRAAEASAARPDCRPVAAARRATDTVQGAMPAGARVVDRSLEETNTPVETRAHTVKEAFDKRYSENVLDAIFSDVLSVCTHS